MSSNSTDRNHANARRWMSLRLLALIVVAGCGGETSALNQTFYPVQGKVLLADGKPLTTGSVLFVGVSAKISIPAPIGSDGAFEFKSSPDSKETTDGLPAGEYRVSILMEARQAILTKGSKARPKVASVPFPARYLDEDASKLTATVKPDSSSNDFTFTLAK